MSTTNIARATTNANPKRTPKPAPAPSPMTQTIALLAQAAELLAGLPHVARLLRAVVALLVRPASVRTAAIIDATTFVAEYLEAADGDEESGRGPSADFSALVQATERVAELATELRPDEDAATRGKVATARRVAYALASMLSEAAPERAEAMRATLDKAAERAATPPRQRAEDEDGVCTHDRPDLVALGLARDFMPNKIDRATTAELLIHAWPGVTDPAQAILDTLEGEIDRVALACGDKDTALVLQTIEARVRVAGELHYRQRAALLAALDAAKA